MAAEVQVSGATLDPHTMAQLFRETVLLGESVHLIDLNRRTNDLRLLPVATRPIITGGPAPESWRYEVRLPRPNGEDPLDVDQLPARNVGAEGMIHVRYMPYRAAPWQGVSPLQSAGFTAETLARIEKSLQDDAKMPTGGIMPQPDGVSPTGITQVKAAVTAGKGALTLAETTASGFRPWPQCSAPQGLGAEPIRADGPIGQHPAMGGGHARGAGRVGCPAVAVHVARGCPAGELPASVRQHH